MDEAAKEAMAREAAKDREARRQVEGLLAFYIHLAVFVGVMALLVAINVLTATPWWVHWPLMGWGLGLLAHGFVTLSGMPARVAGWKDRKAQEIKARME